MKKIYVGFIMLLLCSLSFKEAFSQCTGTSYTTGTVAHNGTTTTIGLTYAGEYNTYTLTGAVTGDVYVFSSSVATDYVTLRTSTGALLANGPSPLTYTQTATPVTTIQFHVNKDASCATESVSRIQSVYLQTPYSYTSSTTVQPSTTAVIAGSTNVQVVRLNVVAGGNTGTPLTLSSLNLGTGSMTTPSLVQSARVYYTGTSTTFSSTTQFGNTASTPGSSFSINGSQALVAGTNYFFVVYDVTCNATVGDSLDAEVTSIVINNTTYTPTVTNPAGNRKIAAGTSYTSIANGEWSNPAIWSCGIVPNATTDVNINHAITISGTSNVGGNVTIGTAGSLIVSNGTQLTLGPVGGGNKVLTNNGILTVSGGILNVNGSLIIASGSTFNQSGGDVNVDGNDGTSAGSVGIGTDLIGIGTSGTNYAAGTLNLTGGTITIVDPHFSGTATSTGGAALAFRAASSTNRNLGTGHTLRIGGTTNTNVSTASFGFYIDTYVNSSILQLGNVEVNGGTSNRSLFTNVISGGGAINIGGNLTINSGCRMVDSTITTLGKTLAGNILNNGTLVLSQATVLAVLPGNSTTAVANPTPQSFSGTGFFQNSSVSPNGNIATIAINNTSAAGVTLNVPITVTASLTLTAGKVNTTATNLLTLGYNASNAGTLSNTANAWVNGPFKRWIGASTGNRAFPVGGDSAQLSAINFTTAPTAGGSITARWIAGNAGFPNATPLTEGSLIVNKIASTGVWQLDAADGLAGGNYTSSFTPKGYSEIVDYTKLVLVKRPSAGGDWTLDGTHVTTIGSNTTPTLSRTGMSGFSQFAVGGEGGPALPITFEYLKGKNAGTGNALNWKVNCTSASVTMVLERSADARKFDHIVTSITASQARCGQPFDATDATPLKGTNYYRLKMIDVDGKISYSPVVAILYGKAGAELVGIYPTVVRNEAYLSVTASRTTKMQIAISDMSGKVIRTMTENVVSGSSVLTINTNNIASGVYNITGMLDGVKTGTLRFVKE